MNRLLPDRKRVWALEWPFSALSGAVSCGVFGEVWSVGVGAYGAIDGADIQLCLDLAQE